MIYLRHQPPEMAGLTRVVEYYTWFYLYMTCSSILVEGPQSTDLHIAEGHL